MLKESIPDTSSKIISFTAPSPSWLLIKMSRLIDRTPFVKMVKLLWASRCFVQSTRVQFWSIDGLSKYSVSHYKDKVVVKPCYILLMWIPTMAQDRIFILKWNPA